MLGEETAQSWNLTSAAAASSVGTHASAPPGVWVAAVPNSWAPALRGATPRAVLSGPSARKAAAALVLAATVVLGGRLVLGRLLARPIPPHPMAFDAALQPVASFIEAETGKPFRYPVYVHFVASEKFESLSTLNEGNEETWSRKNLNDAFLVCSDSWGSSTGSCARIKQHTEPSVDAMFLRFLGAEIPMGTPSVPDLPAPRMTPATRERVLHSLSNRDIVGFYTSDTATIYIRGTDLDAVRQTVAHELVHAWQDQQGFLGDSSTGVDSQYVYLAMMEGHAELVADRYIKSLPKAKQALAAQGEKQHGDEWVAKEQADTSPGGSVLAPTGQTRLLELLLGFWPYDAGPAFLGTRSKEQIRDLLKSPPASTWDIMNPTSDGVGRGNKPKLGTFAGKRYTRKRFAIGPLLWSASIGSRNQEQTSARAFRDAWIGDAAVVYERSVDSAVCLFDRVEFIDANGRAAGLTALNRWAANHPLGSNVSVVANGGVQVDVTVCA